MRIRLLRPLPKSVIFPSVTYLLAIKQCTGGTCGWHLIADGPKGDWFLTDYFPTAELLEQHLFEVGIPTKPATVKELILKKLVRENRAEIVEG